MSNLFPKPSPPPQISIHQHADKTRFVLDGWNELDGYGLRNVALWKKNSDRCRQLGMSERDQLRALCAALIHRNHEIENIAMRYAEIYGLLP